MLGRFLERWTATMSALNRWTPGLWILALGLAGQSVAAAPPESRPTIGLRPADPADPVGPLLSSATGRTRPSERPACGSTSSPTARADQGRRAGDRPGRPGMPASSIRRISSRTRRADAAAGGRQAADSRRRSNCCGDWIARVRDLAGDTGRSSRPRRPAAPPRQADRALGPQPDRRLRPGPARARGARALARGRARHA